MNNTILLSIPQLIREVNAGMTRYAKDDAGWGSIQGKYGMTDQEVGIIFSHQKLKDVHPAAFRFQLVDEDIDDAGKPSRNAQSVPAPASVLSIVKEDDNWEEEFNPKNNKLGDIFNMI